jgi:sigma-B regulation protein RsbU (phosphoserine phosphatase)
LKIARRTQRSILPARMPRRLGYDFGSLITPARAIGGDFYDFIHLDKNRLGLAIGDVSGKGLPAALVMALTFSLLRAEVEKTGDPGQIMVNVNRYLLKMNASRMFVTLLYGILDCTMGTFRYARAGHLPPILLDARGDVIPVAFKDGQPLGIFEEVELDLQEVIIPRGGLALLFSDGLNEAADSQNNEFGFERIKQELFTHRLEGAKAICAKLWEAVAAHSHELPHQDDFVTVVVKRHA